MGKLFIKPPEEEDDDDAQRKSNENLGVLAILTKDLLRSDGSPQNRCGEESVDARACELELGIRSANASDALHLEVENAGADDGADKGGDDLGDKGLTGRDLDVVGELEIVAEPNGVRASYIAKGLEIIHGQRVAVNKGAANKFGEHIEGNFDTCHGLDDAHGNDEDDTERQAIKDNSGRSVGVPASDTSNAQSNGDQETNQIPPLRNFGVRLHQSVMDVEDPLVLDRILLAEAGE